MRIDNNSIFALNKRDFLMRRLILSILLIFCYTISFSQQISYSKNYTDMKNITDILAAGNGIWAATKGGGFFYNSGTGAFTTVNKIDGLTSISLSSVTADNSGNIWFGSSDGTLTVYNPANKSTQPILDIYNSGRSSKRINDEEVSGDTIIVSHDFGVSLVDSKNLVFFDTFFRFGSLPSNIKVNSAYKTNIFYVCTQFGIGIQKTGAVNLSAPESWNIYTSSDGLPSDNALRVTTFGGNIIAATDKGLAQFNGTNWNSFLPQFNNRNVKDILTSGDSLLIMVDNEIDVYKNDTVYTLDGSGTATFSQLGFSQNLGAIAASNLGIFIAKKTGTDNYIKPDGPAANQFPSMAVDSKGNLWSASGKDGSGVGFYKFNGVEWTNFNSSGNSALHTNDFYRVYVAPDNSVYLGSWGAGFIKITDNQITSFDTTGTGMIGIPANSNFLVITGFAVDTKNNLWVMNYWPGDGNTFSVYSPDKTWHQLKVTSESNLTLEEHFGLVIDQSGTKWYYIRDSRKSGLYYFNENGTITSQADDISGFINSSSGLNSSLINSMVIDNRNDLWVATSSGANVITNLSSIASGSNSLKISNIITLSQQTINCIAVDALNQKWIGTNGGLLLLNADGSSLLASYTTKNSALLSDQVVSVAIDVNSGIVYAGTNEGITAFKTLAEKPQSEFTSLTVYPSPFRLKNGQNQLTIKGLVKDSDIKILTISGKLIRQLSSPGGNVAFWDGKNDSGELVSSGIYLVVAYDKEGNNVVTGKVAVLHE